MRVKIPFKTPSVNHLYGTGRYGQKFLKADARELRARIIDICYEFKDEAKKYKGKLLKLVVYIYENWYYKNGKVKRCDIANREKFLIDSVFEGLELDDRFIFDHTLIKVNNEKEESLLRIEQL